MADYGSQVAQCSHKREVRPVQMYIYPVSFQGRICFCQQHKPLYESSEMVLL